MYCTILSSYIYIYIYISGKVYFLLVLLCGNKHSWTALHYIGSIPHGISIQSGLAFCECMSLKYRSDRGKKRIKASHNSNNIATVNE